MRALFFFVCTALSFLGFFYPVMFIAQLLGMASSGGAYHQGSQLSDFLWNLAIGGAVSYAWLCYFIMGVAWIKNSITRKWWPISGTVAAIVLPVMSAATSSTLSQALRTFSLPLLLVLPAAVLALWLVVHHLKQGRVSNAR